MCDTAPVSLLQYSRQGCVCKAAFKVTMLEIGYAEEEGRIQLPPAFTQQLVGNILAFLKRHLCAPL